jgi:hypothetical protein
MTIHYRNSDGEALPETDAELDEYCLANRIEARDAARARGDNRAAEFHERRIAAIVSQQSRKV